MAFNQAKLDKSVNQARGIFDKFIYSTSDSSIDIQSAGYFSRSRYLTSEPNEWSGGVLEALTSDGYNTYRISGDGESLAVLSSDAPGFGQVIVSTSANKRIFTFSANGSDERAKLADLYQYFADELAADRAVSALMGVGAYGLDGSGLIQTFPNGSKGLHLRGMGNGITKIGFVGSNPSGSDWGAMEFSPVNSPNYDVLGATQSGGVASIEITGHGATVDDIGTEIRIDNANEVEYNGLKRISGVPDVNHIEYAIDAGAAATATGTLRASILAQYLQDFSFFDFDIIDTNPSAHAAGGEETHGLQLKNVNVLNTNIKTDGIGDESIELLWCEQYNLIGNTFVNAPSVQTAGGGAISIKNGCHRGVIDRYSIGSMNPLATNSYGINLKCVVHAEPISDLFIGSGYVFNPTSAGLRLNTGSAAISDIRSRGMTVVGGNYAIDEGGSGFLLSDIDIDRLTAREQTVRNVSIDRALADVDNFKLSNSNLDGSHFTGDTPNVFANGSNLKFFDNDYKNAAMLLWSTNNTGLLLRGGTSKNNGGAGIGLPIVYDQTVGADSVVDNLEVTDSQVDGMYFRGVDRVINCPKMQSVNEVSSGAATGFSEFSGNKKVVAKLLNVDNDNADASDNSFEPLSNPSAVGLMIVKGSGVSADRNRTTQTSNPLIRFDGGARGTAIGNKAPLLASGNGIEEKAATAADYNTISDNHLNGRPVSTIGANTTISDNK